VSTNVLGGRYRITEKIGTGGMADVYKAIDETLGRAVAVKVMHTKYASDPSFTQRFRQEAQAAANLQSPNIVNIYDWGQEGDYYYIVMEYVRGTDLKSVIKQKGALTSRQVAEIGAQVCNALSVAHGYDIIHRDIKPHNIMATPDGMVKVMDFGIARAGNTTMTQTGSVLGTAHYVSPEQAQGRALTSASDLYSLGVVLYEASTGRVPFDADTPVAVALKQVNEQPQRPSRINPGIDPRLEEIIGRAMAKDPRQRYSTAEEMRKDLVRIVDGSSALDATTVLSGAALAGAGVVGANDMTTVLPSPDGTGTTVMPAIEGQGGSSEALNYPTYDQAAEAKKAKKRRNRMIGLTLLSLLIVGGLLYWGISMFDPTIAGVEVPSVTDLTRAEAIEVLTELGFEVDATNEQYDATIEAGHVISQDPKAGERAEEGSTIKLVISLGVEMGIVPELYGLTEAEAKELIGEAGFQADPQPGINSAEVAPGRVISQDPPAGTELAKGSTVAYTPSLGAEVIEVPSVIEMDSVTAENTLVASGFFMTILEDYSDTVAAGLVISQNPGAGTRVEKGSSVSVVVSLGKKVVEIEVPSVVGVRVDTAQTLLKNAGLNSTIEYKKTNNTRNVVTQNPASGAKVPEGTTITLTVDADPPQ